MGWSTRLSAVAYLGFAALIGAATHVAHRSVDEVRYQGSLEDMYYFVPDPEAVRVAAMGFHTMFGDLMWVRTVLLFSDMMREQRPEALELLRSMLLTVSTLDPRWRSSHFYGGGMLRVQDDIDGSDEMYRRGMAGLPQDPFFPFSLGMNAYLYRKDEDRAAKYLLHASKLPGAPKWYRSAAASFLNEQGRASTALRYLEEQMKATDDPEMLEVLAKSHARIAHDFLSSRLDEARRSYEAQTGRALISPSDLGTLPPDPHGGTWILASDGVIRSSVEDARLADRDAEGEKRLLAPPAGAPGVGP